VRKSRKPASASAQAAPVASADAIAAKASAIAWLRAHSSPRLMMSLMLASTVGCGFLASMTMHRLGVTAPLIRYPIVVLIAWAIFLFLVGVWVWWYRRTSAQHAESRDIGNQQPVYWSDIANGDAAAVPATSTPSGCNLIAGITAESATNPVRGSAAAAQPLATGMTTASPRRASSGDWNLNPDGDDAGFVLLLLAVIAVAFAVLGVVFYAVYSAPTFFAELLINGGVGTWLYKRMDVKNSSDALSIAIKRSAWPVAILVAMFVVLALAMRYVAPEATTLGEAWHAVRY
jgi:hypothetical protein